MSIIACREKKGPGIKMLGKFSSTSVRSEGRRREREVTGSNLSMIFLTKLTNKKNLVKNNEYESDSLLTIN